MNITSPKRSPLPSLLLDLPGPPGGPSRLDAVVFVLPPVDAAREGVFPEVVPLDGRVAVHAVADVAVDHVALLVRRAGRALGALSGFPLGTSRSDLAHQLADGLAWGVRFMNKYEVTLRHDSMMRWDWVC